MTKGTRSGPILFQSLGRRGAAVRFGHEVARVLKEAGDGDLVLMSNRSSDFSEAFATLGHPAGPLIGGSVFRQNAGAALASWRIPLLRRHLRQLITQHQIEHVVDLMPHVWSPLLVGAIRASGAQYLAVAHDVNPHPGDLTALPARWAERALRRADRILTLSDSVADRVLTAGFEEERLVRLFHPVFSFAPPRLRRRARRPFRVLFLGRILPYKGLDVLIEAVATCANAGQLIELMVYGEGDLRAHREDLKRIGATVVNRWLSDAEIAAAVDSADIMVLSHREASQSGLVATSFGAALPVIVTPVGALPEQVRHGYNGLVAGGVSSRELGESLSSILESPHLFDTLADGAFATSRSLSFSEFVSLIRRSIGGP